MDYSELSPSQLVDKMWDKTQRGAVMRALLGGITATELRSVKLSDEVKAALIAGLKHRHSKIRWWCIQMIDHVGDESYVPALLEAAYTDPTPRNRRHAIHAITCEMCKPNRQKLKVDVRDELGEIARLDMDISVREMALHELAELV
jgi:hypothetical protein